MQAWPGGRQRSPELHRPSAASSQDFRRERPNRVAARANIAVFGAEPTARYVDAAPHIKHGLLRVLYGKLVAEVFDFARQHSVVPRVLDLGAGEGSSTLPFLELGARVVAVDASRSQLDALRSKCERFGDMLEVRCEDINDTLHERNEKYDVVLVTSVLHHVPDYMGLIREAAAIIAPHGQFFSFQDPRRYDSVGTFTMMFSLLSYFSWRIFKGDVIGGLKRRLRRSRGIYLDDSLHDNAEYHVVRNGVDQDVINRFFQEQGFDCRIASYFSTQSYLFQLIGTALGLKSTFAVIARHGQRVRSSST